MQQYFTDQLLNVHDKAILDEESLYHLKKVLRKQDGWLFRMADKKGKIYLCELKGNEYTVKEELNEDNELKYDITVILSLVKSDKFELCLQKLCELGVKRIVPYKARRSVIEINRNSKYDRFRKILKEASEQSHRNIIPEISEVISIKDIPKYRSDYNFIAYEKETIPVSDIKSDGSITIVIGPEGGFEKEEVEEFEKYGFKSVSLGKRILRAETAAIFFTSLITGKQL